MAACSTCAQSKVSHQQLANLLQQIPVHFQKEQSHKYIMLYHAETVIESFDNHGNKQNWKDQIWELIFK